MSAAWFLPIGCFSIIVKHEAVVRVFPGGEAEFELAHRPIRKHSEHYLLMAFSQSDAQALLAGLSETGLQPGEDIAGADQCGTPVFNCSGLEFTSAQVSGPPRWQVEVARTVWQPPQEPPARHALVVVDYDGRIHRTLQGSETGLAVARREQFGVHDSWDEYLCAFSHPWGFMLDVFRYEWLGPVPRQWFGEDGEPLPEHLDPQGSLKLPEVIDGTPVLAHMYGGFVGPFQSVCEGSVRISDHSEDLVLSALEALGWDRRFTADVQEALRQIEAAHGYRPVPMPPKPISRVFGRA
jgi:hypothetical protein